MLAEPAAARNALDAALRSDLPSVAIGSALAAIAVAVAAWSATSGGPDDDVTVLVLRATPRD